MASKQYRLAQAEHGRRGGLKRAELLTPEQRSKIARKAAAASVKATTPRKRRKWAKAAAEARWAKWRAARAQAEQAQADGDGAAA